MSYSTTSLSLAAEIIDKSISTYAHRKTNKSHSPMTDLRIRTAEGKIFGGPEPQ